MLTITGQLIEPGRYYRTLDGDCEVRLRVRAAVGHPFEATLSFGKRPEDSMRAERAARQMLKDMECEVSAQALRVRLDHDIAVYELNGIERADVWMLGTPVDVTKVARGE